LKPNGTGTSDIDALTQLSLQPRLQVVLQGQIVHSGRHSRAGFETVAQ
jgi:microcystin degradation protein MlrC